MNESLAIVKADEQSAREGKRTVLATIVRTSGSAYRRAGAKMLVSFDENGNCSMTGAISGGCLERDVCERARACLDTGAAVLVKYDTTSDSDIVWGLGLGCNGVVEVLLEPLATLHTDSSSSGVDGATGAHPIAFLAERLRGANRGVMATVFEVSGAINAERGERLVFDGSVSSTLTGIGDDELRSRITEDARIAFADNRSFFAEYELRAGRAAVFFEAMEPPIPLVIFGAGADALPLVRLADEIGWQVTVVDHRPAFITPERFPGVHSRIVCRPEEVSQKVTLDERTVVVLMSHNYEHDKIHLAAALASEARYVGCLGPRKRTDRMLSELRSEGVAYGDEDLARLFAPVGLDIGAETPAEIALSIVAEIRAITAGRSGTYLRNVRGSIHGDMRGERPVFDNAVNRDGESTTSSPPLH